MNKEQKEYVEKGGENCYKSGSSMIEGGEVTISPGRASQNAWCTECDHEWTAEYTLTSVSES